MNKPLLLTASFAALAMVSCKNSEFEGYTKAENGMHYKFYNHDENGVKPKEGDGVAFSFMIKQYSKDSTLVDSKQVTSDGSGIFKYLLPKSSFSGSIEDALSMMSTGDSASFIISADSFFLRTQRAKELPPHIKPGEHLAVYLKVTEVKSKADIDADNKKAQAEMEKKMKEYQEKEQAVWEKYLADNKITQKPTESGLILVETKKGSGPKPKAGDVIKVAYTGRLMDGTMFDTSNEAEAKAGNIYYEGRPYEPIEFPVGTGRVIAGWEEAFMMMNKGTKAKLIIPSNLGYGPQGNGPVIHPYAPLVFDVELVEVSGPQATATPVSPGK
jgi:FKBP-type peptidyl-prolyl cis-trans isomerase FkpA